MSNGSLLNSFEKARKRPFNQENTETDTQWDYSIDESGKLTLRFEESRSSIDWKLNFSFLRQPYRGMKPRFRVHSGFLKKYKSIRTTLFDVLAKSEYTTIEILGYSQGGALALLAHEDIWFHKPDFREGKLFTITFATPKVFGWRAPKERWHGVVRIQNGNDAVTKIPFWFLGYKHVGTPINLGSKRVWWKISLKEHLPDSYKDTME